MGEIHYECNHYTIRVINLIVGYHCTNLVTRKHVRATSMASWAGATVVQTKHCGSCFATLQWFQGFLQNSKHKPWSMKCVFTNSGISSTVALKCCWMANYSLLVSLANIATYFHPSRSGLHFARSLETTVPTLRSLVYMILIGFYKYHSIWAIILHMLYGSLLWES